MKQTYILCKSCKELTIYNSNCEHCGNNINNSLTSRGLSIIIDNSSPSYAPSIGKMVKNNTELRNIAKQRGWTEVGNEKVNLKPRKKEYAI